MKRSGGVTAAAVVLIFGSVLVLAVAPVSVGPVRNSFGARSALFSMLYICALAVGGLITGIGLLRLLAWARASLLLFSVYGIWWILEMTIDDISFALGPPEHGIDPNVFRESIILGLPGNLVLLVILTWWIVLLLLPSVRRQFVPADAARRPLPLSLMLVGVGLIALVPQREAMFLALPMRLPRSILWYSVHGLAGPIYNIAVIVAAVVLGLGVLNRARWGQIGAVAYCLFMIFDYGYWAWRFVINTVPSFLKVRPSFWEVMRNSFTTAASDVLGFVLLAVALYLLWSHRAAFAKPRITAEGAANVEGGAG